jgi:hypothetical protein
VNGIWPDGLRSPGGTIFSTRSRARSALTPSEFNALLASLSGSASSFKPVPNEVPDWLDRDPQVGKYATRDPVLIPEQTKEYMLALDREVSHRSRLVLRPEKDLRCLVGELYGHTTRIAVVRHLRKPTVTAGVGPAGEPDSTASTERTLIAVPRIAGSLWVVFTRVSPTGAG